MLSGVLGAATAVLGRAGDAGDGRALAVDRVGDPLPRGAIQRLGTLRMRYPSGIGDLCYLPDGRGVIAVGGQVEIWNLADGELERSDRVCEAGLVSVVPRSDGEVLLVADSSGRVLEWDLPGKHVLRSWATGQAGLRRACYSPDGERVLTTGAKPPTIKEWELASGSELVLIEGEMHYFHEAVYGPEARTAFVNGGAGSGPVLAHYDLSTGKALKQWHKDYYTHGRSIALSADRERLLVGSRHVGAEWRLEGYELLKRFKGHHGHAVTAIAYCREPEQLLTGSRDGSIRRWSRIEGKVLLRWWPHNHHVTRIAVSPDGKWVLSYGGGRVAECSMATGEPRVQWERHSGVVTAVSFLPDGERVLSASADGTLRVWDVATGASVRVITGAKLGAYCVAVSADGAMAAAGCKDGVVREFRVSDGELTRELKGHRGYVRSAVYAPDGKRLLSCAGDGSICVWDHGVSEPTARLEGHRGGVLCVAVSGDGGRAISGGRDGTVRLWDLGRPEPVWALDGHFGWVEAVAFVGDGEQAVSVGRDNLLIRWDLDKAEEGSRIEHAGHHAAVVCSPDRLRVFSAGSDAAIACWDLETGEQAAGLSGHRKAVTSLALSPDGRTLVSASEDTTLLVWDIGPR